MPHDKVVYLDIRRPFTYAEAVAAGVTPSAMRGRNFRKIFRGVYAHRSLPNHPLFRTKAALLIHPPDAFASHVSAGRVHGVPLPELVDEHISVFAEKDRRRRAGIRNHIAAPDTPVTVLNGDRVSSPDQMFVELAGLLSLVDLVVVGDYLVRHKKTKPEQLLAFCAGSAHRNAAAARRAAAYVREDVDSAMETRLRMLIVLAGLPEPKINHKIFFEDGRLRYRFDLSYPEFKVIVEYDGRQHREDLDQWDADTDRKDWFDHNGWKHVPVFSRGIYRRPDLTLERVRSALKDRGCTTLPRVLADDWRPFFPVKR
jgi:very-short-patch-repair endonuclease